MLVQCLPKRKPISFIGWSLQFHLFIVLAITDYSMVIGMVYDPYTAIRKPLLHATKCPDVPASPWLLFLLHIALQWSALAIQLRRPPVDPVRATTGTVQTHLS